MVADPVLLQGLGFPVPKSAPLILQRSEPEFLDVTLNELQQKQLGGMPLEHDKDNLLKLYQPVHKVFHLALMQVACDVYGQPRLDPTKIDSAGLVVRRLGSDDTAASGLRHLRPNGTYQAWMKTANGGKQWLQLRPFEELQDPDPAKRQVRLRSGNGEIDRRLALLANETSGEETIAPLFTASPDVCRAAGKTVLYGVVPVTSPEQSEAASSDRLPYTADYLKIIIPPYFTAGGARSIARAGQTLSYANVQTALDNHETDLIDFTGFLQMLDPIGFRDPSSGGTLAAELNSMPLSYGGIPSTKTSGQFLLEAIAALGSGKASKGSVTIPDNWPAVSAAQASRIQNAVVQYLDRRLSEFTSREGRFEDPTRLYVLRTFARITRPDGCPPVLVWSDYSEPFFIAPWYESAGLPPARISLPDITKDNVSSMKPNVAFNVPASLASLLTKDAKGMSDGEDKGGFELGIDWICSFSLPIITFCAFICLNIFLKLFDLFFSWMFFIKICIPIPRPVRKG